MKKVSYTAAIVAMVLVVGLVGSYIFPFRSALRLSTVQAIKIGSPMPRHVDVLGVQWRVDVVRFPDPSIQGFTECDKHVILMSSVGIHARQTLIHETLHAAVCHYDAKAKDFIPANLWYNSKTEDGHEGFNNIAGVISELLARNPDLASWEAEGDISLGMVTIK